MNGKKYRKIIITTVLFILGMIISKFNINLEGKIAEILQTIDNYSFLVAVFLIIGFLCSITYKRKGRYIKMLSELTLFAGAVVIAVRSFKGSIGMDFWSVCLFWSILLGEYFASIRKKCIDTKNCTLLRRAFFFFQRRDNNKICKLLRKIFYFFNEKDIDRNGQIENTSVINHKPIKKYNQLYGNRKSQCDLVAKIIENEKIISDGYSICISGEWGSGKTSFIEAVLDKLKSGNQEKVDYSVIRINALELENINTLIEYYFKALKNILDEKGAYSGFKSEYKEMVNSFLKIASHDSIADYVTNKLYPQNDYRKSIEELDKLIKDVMKDERIIIVVDDIDRCSDKKVTETMFFVKEIATRSNCVSFFLVEYNKLKESKLIGEFGDGFLEKFFNRVVAINKADYTEILKRFHDPSFEGNIYKVLDYYNHSIESAKETLNHNLKSENYKSYEELLKEAEDDYKDIDSQLSNPRKLIKAHEHYKLLKGVVNEIKGNVNENDYSTYLKKIEYQKQLVLISLLYGFHPDLYTHFECEGIEKIIGNESDKYSIERMLYNEYGDFGTASYKDEKKNFIKLIVSEPNKIIDIANPYDSEFSEYTDYFDKGINLIDKGISFEQCIKVLFKNTGINGGEKYISKAFDLYKSTLSFDKALWALQSERLTYLHKPFIISDFYEYFCNKSCIIENKSYCQQIFKSSSYRILKELLHVFWEYNKLLQDDEKHNNQLSRIDRDINDCKSVKEGTDVVITYLGRVLGVDFKSNDIDGKMNELISNIEQKYSVEYEKLPIYKVIQEIHDRSKKAIKEINALINIEKYVFTELNNHSVNNSTIERLKDFKGKLVEDKRDKDKEDKDKKDKDKHNTVDPYWGIADEFVRFINKVVYSDDVIDDNILNELSSIIAEISKYNDDDAFEYCKFYKLLNERKEKRQKAVKELAVSNEKEEEKPELATLTAESDSK